MRYRPGQKGRKPENSAGQSQPTPAGQTWIWGLHPVKAALANPKRRCRRLIVARTLTNEFAALTGRHNMKTEIADHDTISKSLPRDAVHQGVALLVDPLPELDLTDMMERSKAPRRLIMLDQVTDPHNLGAILRSAAAFGACGVIVQDRHSPPITGVLAKAASGAVETVPILRVTNLSRTLEELGELGFLRLAFADEAAEPLNTIDLKRDLVLALGAEGEGLRRLTREHCDLAVRLPTQPAMPSLNVSNAAAVALYACAIA